MRYSRAELLLRISDIGIKVSSYFVSGGSSLASVVAGSKPTRSWDKPHFDDIAPRNVTAIVGQTAELNCYVKHPGDRVVSNIFSHIYRAAIVFPTRVGCEGSKEISVGNASALLDFPAACLVSVVFSYPSVAMAPLLANTFAGRKVVVRSCDVYFASEIARLSTAVAELKALQPRFILIAR